MSHLFHLLLRPGTRLMRRLGLRNKMLLIAAALVAPWLLLGVGPALAGWRTPITATSLAFSVYLALSFYLSLTGALRAMLRAVQALAEGDMSHTVQIHGQDELAQIGHTLEAMSARLSAMVPACRPWWPTSAAAPCGWACRANRWPTVARPWPSVPRPRPVA
jgi:HAMP domain-containing protein